MEDSGPPSRLRRALKWVKIALTALLPVLLGVMLWYALYARSSRLAYEHEIAAIRAAGDPVTYEELAPPPLPEKANAGPLLIRAARELPGDDPSSKQWAVYKDACRGRETTREEWAAIYEELLEPNAVCLEAVRKALQLPAARFDLDYSTLAGMELPHLAMLSYQCQLLDMSARRAGDRGRPDQAISEIGNIMKLGKLLETEPIMISQLVRAYFYDVACRRYEAVLHAGGASEKALLGAARVLRECPNRAAFVMAVKGDRALGASTFGTFLGACEGPPPQGFVTTAFQRGLRAPFHEGAAAYLRHAGRLIEALGEPHLGAAPRLKQIDEEFDEEVKAAAGLLETGYLLAELLRPPVRGLEEQDTQREAWMTVLRLACLVEVYRLRDGRRPAGLADLVPSLLGELPTDPFSGKGYIYRAKEGAEGYVIYSLGSNLTDDGGVPGPLEKGRRDFRKGNILFER